MSMELWDTYLRALADDEAEYVREGGLVVLTRHGRELTFRLKEVPAGGLSVADDEAGSSFTPIGSYVQRDVLGLPRLAGQILKTLEKTARQRPGQFVEGPAQAVVGKTPVEWRFVGKELAAALKEAEPGTTRLIQLMAQAGQGKTVLLEQIAMEFARSYHPDPYPTPILLPVDLLGRYVGTIDDAIAGSLNNTYVFPGLSQRDVALCIRNRWLLLALDGFDELVARVGPRDAFQRITELLDQLKGSGTVVISARESFFELHQITSAIRSYLQPKAGSYSTLIAKLLPWTRTQGIQVFANQGSPKPEQELDDLLRAFEDDAQIVLHPFFMTRLAALWMRGERFSDASQQADRLTRTKYVIETFIDRESTEKWITRDGKPLLDTAEHTIILGVIAEEMWRSGAFRLTVDELKVAAEIGLSEAQIADDRADEVLNRIPTHAALISKERGYSFLHDRFLHFFLGSRLATLLARREQKSLEQVLLARELSPQIVEWVCWKWKQLGDRIEDVIGFLNGLASGAGESGVLDSNTAVVMAALLREHRGKSCVVKKTFVGDALKDGTFVDVEFVDCHFWHVDFGGSKFQTCIFRRCEFGDIRVVGTTRFDGSILEDCDLTSIEVADSLTAFSPSEIEKYMAGMGAKVVLTSATRPPPIVKARVRSEIVRCVERFLKQSERTCDVAIEDMEEDFGNEATSVASIGLRTEVFKEVHKGVSGPMKRFVRFRIDRDRMLGGQIKATGDAAIDAFWNELARKFPPK